MPRIQIDVHTDAADLDAMRSELRAGLLSTPRTIPTKYLYDDEGSALFERISELPEYYQTRTERELLAKYAEHIIACTDAQELVELGSGAATKTRILLNVMHRADRLRMYVPFDVSEGIVRRVAQELVLEYPTLQIHGIVGDFLAHLEHIPNGGRRLVVFLGGTIGNFSPTNAVKFLSSIYRAMEPGDYFLLGVQLEADVARLEAAYNDTAGVTARFNKNILSVLRARIGADFDPDTFDHSAVYNRNAHRIEMRLRARYPLTVYIRDLDLTLNLQAGEELLTEISTKYDRPRAETLLAAAGFLTQHWYTDPHALIGLALAQKPI
ncbi:MAG: L-histidine N(alpha)-methyltransferase [Nitrospirae bacterium]|nr:MAG: L-histidine N(alpha)-methyltransferase [Nitrospirota bacterium]